MTGKTVLLVEDDPAVRKITTRMLDHMGMRVVAAGSGEEALAMLDRMGPVDLLLSDVVLPGMKGMSFVIEFLRRRPDTPYLFVTGWFSHPALEGMGDSVLAKPFGHTELAAAVASAFELADLVAAQRSLAPYQPPRFRKDRHPHRVGSSREGLNSRFSGGMGKKSR